MITTASPIVGKGGTAGQVVSYLLVNNPTPPPTWKQITAYLYELERLCELVQFDFSILAAQSAHETDNWTSSWWVNRHNPAGIGITGDPTQDAASHNWATGTDAARAHVAHMVAYVWGIDPQAAHPELRKNFYIDSDPRYQAVFAAGFAGTVKKLGDLGNGKWATDKNYATQIAAKANAIFKEEPVTEASVTFGNVPHPPFVDRLIPDDENGAWDDLGALEILGAVHHTMVGSLMGTDNWFRRGPNPKTGGSDGLTNYGIGGSTDGELDGVLIRWNDPTGAAHDVNYPAFGGNADHNGHVSANRAGWASGGVDGQEGDGPPFVARYGANAVNTKLVSIERSDGGNTSTPPSHRQNETAAFITAWVFDRANVRYDSFPVNQNVGLVTDFFHYEFALKGCPDPVYKAAYVDTVQPRVKELLQAWQTNTALATPLLVTYPPGYTGPQIVQPGGTVVPVPTPEPTVPTVPWKRGDVGHKRIGTVPALAYVVEVTARKDAPVRVAASAKKDVAVIDTIATGKTGVAIGGFISGGRKWLAIDRGPKGVGRALASDFHEVLPMP